MHNSDYLLLTMLFIVFGIPTVTVLWTGYLADKPKPSPMLVIRRANNTGILTITAHTEHAKLWVWDAARGFGAMFHEDSELWSYTLLVKDGIDPEKVVNYLNSYNLTRK